MCNWMHWKRENKADYKKKTENEKKNETAQTFHDFKFQKVQTNTKILSTDLKSIVSSKIRSIITRAAFGMHC